MSQDNKIKKEKAAEGKELHSTLQMSKQQSSDHIPLSFKFKGDKQGKNHLRVMVLPKPHTTLTLEQTGSDVLNKTSAIMLSRVCIDS